MFVVEGGPGPVRRFVVLSMPYRCFLVWQCWCGIDMMGICLYAIWCSKRIYIAGPVINYSISLTVA